MNASMFTTYPLINSSTYQPVNSSTYQSFLFNILNLFGSYHYYQWIYNNKSQAFI